MSYVESLAQACYLKSNVINVLFQLRQRLHYMLVSIVLFHHDDELCIRISGLKFLSYVLISDSYQTLLLQSVHKPKFLETCTVHSHLREGHKRKNIVCCPQVEFMNKVESDNQNTIICFYKYNFIKSTQKNTSWVCLLSIVQNLLS